MSKDPLRLERYEADAALQDLLDSDEFTRSDVHAAVRKLVWIEHRAVASTRERLKKLAKQVRGASDRLTGAATASAVLGPPEETSVLLIRARQLKLDANLIDGVADKLDFSMFKPVEPEDG